VKADGTIEVFSAVNGMGQGIATTLAQLVVDVFGVPMEQVKVVLGDTDRGDGFGSAGLALDLHRRLGHAHRLGAHHRPRKQLAAKELEAAAEDIAYTAGRFSVKGTDVGIDLFALAGKQDGGRIHMDSTSTVAGPTWPNGCHISEVELDPATGEVQIVALQQRQRRGPRGQPDDRGGPARWRRGAGHRPGAARAHGLRPRTGQLRDRQPDGLRAPRADIMACDFVTEMDESTPCKNNPLGVKGVGELGTIGATPSVVNAVADALARAGHGAQAPGLQMPLTAAQRPLNAVAPHAWSWAP
jgi:carbon-monoxide dehydrogenase large subunit